MDAQQQTFPYPAVSKWLLCSNVLMAKSGAQSLTFKSVTDRQKERQTDRQTDKSTNCRHRRAAAKTGSMRKTLILSTLGRKGKREK